MESSLFPDHPIKQFEFGNFFNLLIDRDVQSGLLLKTLQGHTEVVRTLQFDSEKVVSGSYDGTVRIWNIKTGDCMLKLPHHSNSRIFKVIFNDTKIVSCLQSGLIVIYNFAHNIPHYKIYEV